MKKKKINEPYIWMDNNGRFVYKFVGAKLEVQNKRYRANDFLLILFNSGEICFSIKKKERTLRCASI